MTEFIQDSFETHDGIKVHRIGSDEFKDAIIASHGAWGNHEVWKGLGEKIAKTTESNVFTFDLPDHGQEGRKSSEFLSTLDDVAQALQTVQKYIKIKSQPNMEEDDPRIIAIGHSRALQDFARYSRKYNGPSDIKDFILLSPGDILQGTFDYLKRFKLKGGINFLRSLLSWDIQALIDNKDIAQEVLFPKNMRDFDTTYREYTSSESMNTYLNMLFYRGDIDEMGKRVKKGDIDTHILHGSEDNLFSIQNMKNVASRLNIAGNDKIILLDGGSHYLPLESDEIQQEIADKISGIIAGDRK